MIYRDRFGYLRQIPDGQFGDGFGDYSDAGEVIYDGFGNPLGILPFLAALAPVLKPLALKLIPQVAAALPGLISRPRAAAPAPPPPAPTTPPVSFPPPAPAPAAPTIIQVPMPMPMMPPIAPPMPAPGAQRPVFFARRRRPRRRVPVRLRVREEVTAPPGAAVRVQPPFVSVSPRAPVPSPVPAPSVATESSGEMSGAFYGPFDNFF
jgi:hypothetical protein